MNKLIDSILLSVIRSMIFFSFFVEFIFIFFSSSMDRFIYILNSNTNFNVMLILSYEKKSTMMVMKKGKQKVCPILENSWIFFVAFQSFLFFIHSYWWWRSYQWLIYSNFSICSTRACCCCCYCCCGIQVVTDMNFIICLYQITHTHKIWLIDRSMAFFLILD